MAGLGPEADRFLDAIEGAKSCINLIEDIKNETVSDPNKELIRSINNAVKDEIRSIKADLKGHRLGKNEIESTADVLIVTTRLTVKQLAQDDDALLDAARLPDSFFKILVHRAEPLPDWCDDTISTLYRRLLKRVSEEFVARAQNFDRFGKVALASLLRDALLTKKQSNRIERGVQENREINLETNRLVKKFTQRHFSSTPSRVFFGSRPDVAAKNRFVERSEQEHLNAMITDPTKQRTVLVGMRGCGKTQLAAALAQECEDANWNLVAWINAVSRESIQSDLVELAKQLGIGTSDHPTQDQVIHSFLSRVKSAEPADRLIVLDNVENIDDLRGLVPSGNGLRVVATTTNNTGWAHQGWETIKVGVFDRDESINYLLTATESTDHDAADTLAHRLGDLPLALAQAAATAHNRDLSLARYMDRLDSYRSERVIRPARGDYYAEDVATALCMAIEEALENLENGTKQAALRQLGALALLAESGVPTRWLDPTIEHLDDRGLGDANQAADEDAHDALTELIHRSIVQQSTDKTTTMLHRLQAQVLRESWNKREYTQACESAINILATVNVENFPRDHGKARRIETLNLIEQISALGQQEHSHQLLKFEDVWLCINHTFEQTLELGLSDRAGSLARTVDVLTDSLPPEHRYPIVCQSYLAGIFEQAGQLPRALAYQNKAVFDSKLFLGPDDKFTLLQLRLLADIRASAGDYQYAIDQYRHLLKHPVIKRNNIERVSILNNLGHAYHSKRQFKQALPFFKKALQITEKIRGEEDRQTLKARNNLATTYLYVGMSEKAISRLLALRDDCEHILGPDDILTLTVRKGIAHAYASEIDLAEGVVRYESLLNDCTDTFDPEHPFTVEVREELEAARRDLAKEKDASHTEEHGSEG